MNPIHDNNGNLLAVEMNGSRISAEALARMAARVEAQERDIDRLTAALSKAAQDAIALETQLLAAQKANTALIERVVGLEHERDAALTTIRIARQRLYDAHGRGPETVAQVIRAVGYILRRDDDPAETPVPPPIPIGDALSSVASQLAVMMIQKRIDAGHPITFAGDAPPAQEGEGDE